MPTSPRSRPAAPPAAAAPVSRVLPAAVLVLALAGLAIAVDLWALWHHAHGGGGAAFCDISDRLSCSKVAASPYSAVLRVPVAAWGALAYALVALLAGWALVRRPHPGFPGGLLLVLSGFMTACAIGLAYLSEVVIGAFCVMCAASWTITLVLLVLAVVQVRRAGGARAALGADLAALRARAAPAAVGVASLAAVAVALLVLYAVAPWRTAVAAPSSLIPPGPAGSLVAYEFSDYLCPHCAILHGEEKSILAQRPDLRFVRRFYPLDASCNARVAMTIPGHETSCELARGGVCAEQQGRFEAYDDAAFASQNTKPGAEKLAQMIGLDLGAFRDCMASPDTEQRIARDTAAGIQAGVNGTPTLQIRGKLYTKEDLPGLLGIKPLP